MTMGEWFLNWRASISVSSSQGSVKSSGDIEVSQGTAAVIQDAVAHTGCEKQGLPRSQPQPRRTMAVRRTAHLHGRPTGQADQELFPLLR